MPKVIKKAENKTCICSNCKDTLSYTFDEVKTGTYTCYDETTTKHYIECPTCKENVVVPRWSSK